MDSPSAANTLAARRGPLDLALGALVLAAAALFAGIALLSLQWSVEHDTPFVAYLGFLAGHEHLVPYRDLFEINLPGTFLAFAALDAMFGASDFGFRSADLALMALLAAMTWKWMRPFGWMPAVAGPALFGLYYLHDGPTLCLQREFLMTVLFSAALLCAAGLPRLGPRWRAIGVGVACGLAALFKPQGLVLLPVLAFYLGTEPAAGARGEPRGVRLRPVALCLAAAAAPLAITAGWLAAAGALDDWIEIARHYYPLYALIDGNHRTLEPGARLGYQLSGWRELGGLHLWLIPAGLGLLVATLGADAGPRRRRAVLIAGLAVAASVMPAIAGKFYPYHWLPFFFFVAMLASLALTGAATRVPPIVRGAAIGALLFTAGTETTVAAEVRAQLARRPIERNLGARVATIEGYLRAHLRPGDTVQPLDLTGGSVDAMWRARARLATRFMSDFYFYHHTSSPYIRTLRRRFLSDLERARPRVIVEIDTHKPWIEGAQATREFPALRRFLREHYAADLVGDGFVLHLRREDP